MNRLNIHLPQHDISYDIDFIENFSDLSPLLKEKIGNRKAAFITDQNVFAKSPFFKNFIEKENLLVLPAGEENKTWDSIEKILDHLFEMQCDRSSVCVAIGGGVIGDMAGFASSIFMRGISCVQVPTTLLSMVDSSVGGKTGIDNKHGKNLVGSFHQPNAVICCKDFLYTLEHCELQNGFSEMLKHGIIYSPDHFEDMSKFAEKFGDEVQSGKISDKFYQSIFSLVPDSVRIKKAIVQEDEKEAGVRGFLNLGHTYGHAIELLSDFSIPHGLAVAKGIILASKESEKRGMLEEEKFLEKIEKIFKNFGMNTENSFQNLVEAMKHDKKKKNGKIRIILPKKIGEMTYANL